MYENKLHCLEQLCILHTYVDLNCGIKIRLKVSKLERHKPENNFSSSSYRDRDYSCAFECICVYFKRYFSKKHALRFSKIAFSQCPFC